LGLAASSQSFIGYGYDNYSGVNGVLLNPASIAGSKYKVNVNIVSASAFAGNNAYEMDRSRLFALKFSNLAEGDGYYKINKPEYKYLYTNVDILGPSAMFNIDRRDAIGIITRLRSVGNVYNLGNSLFQLLGNPDPAFYNSDIINRSLQSKVNTFAEAGLSFGRILMEKRTSRLKAGFTAKYIAGLSYGSLSSGQMTINIDPANNIAKLSADVTTQYSPNLDELGGGASISHVFNKQSGNGWGLDLGLVYEWMPNGETYKLRMGLSVTDLGSINYNNSKNGQTYSMNADGHNTSELMKQDGETYDQYFNRLQTAGLIIAKVNGVAKTTVKLPTALHLNADYNIYKRLYINGDVLLNMVATTNQVTPNYNTTFAITPRLEKKWVSIYSPVSYNSQSMLSWGAGLRFGPLFVGSGTVLSSLLKKRIQTADVHVGLTIPIFQTRKDKEKDKDDKKKETDTMYRKILITHDRDSDGVVDEKDACPDSAGPVALIGCPDSDEDGVPNNRDKCPGVKGSPNFEGCPAPDTDGDGVNDDDDKCPLTKGTLANHGCPPISPDLVRSVSRASDRVFFIRARADVEPSSLHELDRVVSILQADSTLRLHIQGHTDSEGTDERNQSLSLRRAKAVKAYLVSKGISAQRMDCRAYGSKRPIAPNSTPEGMAQNRRVDMELANWE
jgi:outer membrane protein OmpA-like peptidoglycan-associated protein